MKQYLMHDEKMISGVKNATIQELYELTDRQYEQTAEDFRKMHMTILDSSTEDIGNYLNTDLDDDFLARMGQDTLSYARIFMGKVPGWELVKVSLYTTGAIFYYYQYDADGDISGWLMISLDVPPQMTLKIVIDGDENHPEESYIVEMEQPKTIKLAYYVGEKLQYTSLIGEDDRGAYELISEA